MYVMSYNQKLKGILEKNTFNHDTVSAKTSDKIFQNIRDFGIKIVEKKSSSQIETLTRDSSKATQPTKESNQSQIQIGSSKKETTLQYNKKCC